MENFSFIIPHQVAGMAYPRSRQALAELSRLGFCSLVSLSERVPPPEDVGTLIHLHCPVADFARSPAIDLQRVVAFVERAPRPIAIHCEGGFGRTGMALACVLVALGRTAPQAVAEVRAGRPGSIDHEDLEASVDDYARFREQGVRTSWLNFASASPLDRIVHGAERPVHTCDSEVTDPVGEWLAFMVRQGIRAVVCLLHQDEISRYDRPLLERCRREFPRVTHVPIRDGSIPTCEGLLEALDVLQVAESEGAKVVVHCAAGIGRTGLILAAWLRTRHGLRADQAIAVVREHAGYFGAFRNPLEAGSEAASLLERVPTGRAC